MAKKKFLKENEEQIWPITRADCIINNNGDALSDIIGDLSLLKTNDKSSIIASINEILQPAVNIKKNLVDVLTARYYDVSVNDNWDTLLALISANLNENVTTSYLLKNCILVTNSEAYNTYGKLNYTNSLYVSYTSTNGITLSIDANNRYSWISFSKSTILNCSAIYITASLCSLGSDGYAQLYAGVSAYNNSGYGVNKPTYKASNRIIISTITEKKIYKIDLSSLKNSYTGYLGLFLEYVNATGYIIISDISIE